MEALVPGVVDHRLRIAHRSLEISSILILGAHPLGIFLKLGRVVRLGKESFQEDGMGDADRLQVFHRGAQNPTLDVLVALENDFPDLDLRPFLHHKRNAHGRRRNLSQFGSDRRELPAMFR
jgi:hypothetical protein